MTPRRPVGKREARCHAAAIVGDAPRQGVGVGGIFEKQISPQSAQNTQKMNHKKVVSHT
jgi:hypothetical protein